LSSRSPPGSDVLVLQKHYGLRTDPREQVTLESDRLGIHAQCGRDPFLGHTVFECPKDHEMLLDRSHPIDLVVVGEGFIVLGDEAECLGAPELLEHVQSEMSVQKGEAAIANAGCFLWKDDQRLDHTDFADRCEEPQVLLALAHLRAHGSHGQDLPDLHHHALGIERHLDRVGHVMLPFGRRARRGTVARWRASPPVGLP